MNTKELKVGQEVAVIRPGYYGARHGFGYHVHKVTPSGQVVIMRDSDNYVRRFDKDGREIGKFADGRLVIDVDEARAFENKQKRSNDAANAIMAVRVDRSLGTYSKQGLLEQVEELQKLVDAARAAVESI